MRQDILNYQHFTIIVYLLLLDQLIEYFEIEKLLDAILLFYWLGEGYAEMLSWWVSKTSLLHWFYKINNSVFIIFGHQGKSKVAVKQLRQS